MAAPVVTYRVNGKPDVEDEWSAERFERYALEVATEAGGDAADAAEMAQGRELATWVYPHAVDGDIDQNLGVRWDCCPRSYALFAPRARIHTAESAIQVALSIRSGVPSDWIFGDARPSSRFLSLVQLVLQWTERRERAAMMPRGE